MPNTALRESLIAVYCCVLVGVNSSMLGLGLLKIYPEKLVKLLTLFECSSLEVHSKFFNYFYHPAFDSTVGFRDGRLNRQR